MRCFKYIKNGQISADIIMCIQTNMPKCIAANDKIKAERKHNMQFVNDVRGDESDRGVVPRRNQV